MKAVMSADEPAKDVAGAEALLERHQEHKVANVMGRREICVSDFNVIVSMTANI